jgi:hypothetical protein
VPSAESSTEGASPARRSSKRIDANDPRRG